MEDLTPKQRKLFGQFIETFKNEESMNALEQFLNLLKENKLKKFLDNINEIYNGSKELPPIKELKSDIEEIYKEMDKVYWSIFEENENGDNESPMLLNIQKIYQKFEKSFNDFYGTKDDKGNVTQQGIITKLQEACKQIQENEVKINKLQEFYKEVFEGIRDSNDKIIRLPLKKKLEEYELEFKEKLSKIDELMEDKDRDFDDLYKQEQDEFDKLLRIVTSAGLADAYMKERENIKKEIDKWSYTFIGSVVLFIVVFLIYFWFSFRDDFSTVSFLRALPFWIFSGFFTFYSTKQIAEYKRMASEYAHKQTLNATYTGYQNQTNEIGDDDLKKKLLEIMLDSAKLNPSETLGSKGEIPSLSVMERIIEHLPVDILQKLYSKIGNTLNKPQK